MSLSKSVLVSLQSPLERWIHIQHKSLTQVPENEEGEGTKPNKDAQTQKKMGRGGMV